MSNLHIIKLFVTFCSLNYTTHSEQILLGNVKARKLLQQYAKPTEPLSTQQYEEMLELLDIYCEPLKEFVADNDMGCGRASGALVDLLHSLASESPVTTVVPHTEEAGLLIQSLVDEVDIRKDPQMWKMMQDCMPIFFDLFSICDEALPIDDSFKKLLKVGIFCKPFLFVLFYF